MFMSADIRRLQCELAGSRVCNSMHDMYRSVQGTHLYQHPTSTRCDQILHYLNYYLNS
jgi:hypothetical protein